MSFAFVASETSDSIAIRAATFSSALSASSCSTPKSPRTRSSVNGRTRDSNRGAQNGVAASSAALRSSCSAETVTRGSVQVLIEAGRDSARSLSSGRRHYLAAGEQVLRGERTLRVNLQCGGTERARGVRAEVEFVADPVEAGQRPCGLGVRRERLPSPPQQTDIV